MAHTASLLARFYLVEASSPDPSVKFSIKLIDTASVVARNGGWTLSAVFFLILRSAAGKAPLKYNKIKVMGNQSIVIRLRTLLGNYVSREKSHNFLNKFTRLANVVFE